MKSSDLEIDDKNSVIALTILQKSSTSPKSLVSPPFCHAGSRKVNSAILRWGISCRIKPRIVRSGVGNHHLYCTLFIALAYFAEVIYFIEGYSHFPSAMQG